MHKNMRAIAVSQGEGGYKGIYKGFKVMPSLKFVADIPAGGGRGAGIYCSDSYFAGVGFCANAA
jgi:hypothetical protein